MLAQIFQVGSLLDEPIDLHFRLEFFGLAEVAAGEFFLDAAEDLEGTCILDFLCVCFVVLRWGNRGAVARAADDARHLVRVCCSGGRVGTHDGLAAFRGVVGLCG